jgi:hypothetical protein
MSKFITTIPVDLDSVLKLLPSGAFLERVSFNGRGVDVVWDHRPFHTGLDFPVPFGTEDLIAKKLPAKVRLKHSTPKAFGVNALNAQASTPVAQGNHGSPSGSQPSLVILPATDARTRETKAVAGKRAKGGK